MIRKIAVVLFVLPLLAACAGSSESTVLRPPTYATPLGVEYYEVRCDFSRVIVSYHSVDIFFKDDESTKTREEFCAEYRSDTLIRRR